MTLFLVFDAALSNSALVGIKFLVILYLLLMYFFNSYLKRSSRKNKHG